MANASEILTGATLPLLNGPSKVAISADYQGNFASGVLPYTVAFTRTMGASDVTTASTWSVSTLNGSITCTIGSATGILSVSALGMSTTVKITAVHGGSTLSMVCTIEKANAPADASGGAATNTVSSSTWWSIQSTAYDVQSGGLNGQGQLNADLVLTPTTTTATLAAPLTFIRSNAAAGVTDIEGKWMYRTTSTGTWTNVAAGVVASTTASTADGTTKTNGYISVAQTMTVTAGSTYRFRCFLRIVNTSGTASTTAVQSGTASATG